VGHVLLPRLILVLFGLWTYSAAGQSETDSIPDTESSTTPSRPVAIPYTKTLTKSAASKPPDIQTKDRILPLEVVINGTKSGTWLLLEREGKLYAPYDAFVEWRVQLPDDAKPIDFKLHDQAYWPLSAVPGYKFKLDFATQSAELLFSPQAFSATRLTQERSKRPVVSPVLPSLFFNYDLNYSTSVLKNSPNVRDLGLLAEIGASNSWGVLTSSHAGRNLTIDAASGTPHSWVRLETTFTKDFPEENHTLRLGDTSTRASMWGRNVYFGGIQYGSNFALTPGFVSQPVPALAGMSTAPSSVEMYVNDVLRQVSSVPTGPFTIDNYPLLTGSGDVRMVVRDILGRETIIEQSFFITTELLSAGLHDWSIEAGRVRRDIGVASNHYGPGFVSGTWRHGYNNDLTLEGRAEATSKLRTIGLGFVSTLPKQMLGKASIGISNLENESGGLWLLGLEHQRLRSSVSFQVQGASINFQQLGQPETVSPIKLQLAGNWSYTSESSGNFGIGLATLNRFDDSRVSTVSGNYSKRIGLNSSLNLTISRSIYGNSGTSVGMYFVKPLGHNRIASASANSHAGQQDFYISATQNPGQESNLGWRSLVGRQQDQSRMEGGVYYMGRYGKWSGDVSASPDQTALRLGANGGLVFADKNLFVTQRVDQSFAVAEIAGYENIGIGLGSNMLSQTDADGVALIPRLMPYQNNAVRLNPSDLPISAEIDSIERNAVPAWRSAVKVEFPVRGGRGALLKIMFDDGEDAPAGAIVKIEGDTEEFYVARRGAAFVTGLQPANLLLLEWKGQQCKIDVQLPPESPDEIPRIGPLLCKGIAR
jgi:outer membrane usher protein